MNVVAFAGGVGGAKLADGLARQLPPEQLKIVVNTGDDFEHFGLKICPDLDTVCYTLAGIANPETGWGRAGETWEAMENIATLAGPTWFRLGDRDLGTHLLRTRLLYEGHSLTEVTERFCRAWGIGPQVLPMSDDMVATMVHTDEGTLSFQEYFVKHRCEPHVRGFAFSGQASASPGPGVLDAIDAAACVVLCPSNPWVSIDPILALGGVVSLLEEKPVVAVSPIIGGKAVKGPAAKMYQELGIQPTAQAVAEHYQKILNGFVFDHFDRDQESTIEALGLQILVTDTYMRSLEDRDRLAGEIILFIERIIKV
jgi:LPPG:FO 2-phospho-L-lactate transferase